MSSISDSIQAKCLAFGDRVIKLNDYLLEQAASGKFDGRWRKDDVKHKTSYITHQTSNISQPSNFKHHTSRVPIYLQSVAVLCNQLLRSGTSISANNAEAISAISKADFKSKSYIALKEARESLSWLELLHRNNYLTDVEFKSLHDDCEELVKLLTHRCKKLDEDERKNKK